MLGRVAPSIWRSPTTLPARSAAAVLWLAIPDVCSPGEGTVLLINKIFWETRQGSGCIRRE
jgi:hypothetical protein